jgi:hypothetical protein
MRERERVWVAPFAALPRPLLNPSSSSQAYWPNHGTASGIKIFQEKEEG